MKSLIVFMLVAVLPRTEVVAQPTYTFSGYVVELPSYQRVNDLLSGVFNVAQDQFVNVTRGRLRPSLSLSNSTQLSAEYEIAGTYFSSAVPFSITPQQRRRQLFDLTWTPISASEFVVTHFIDRLYCRSEFDFGEATIGRQRIAWGTGRIWNPTDLFNPLNPTTFAKIEKDGVDAIAAKFFFGGFTDLMVVWNPQKDGATNWGARIRTNVNEYDVSVIGGYFDQRVVLGGDFAGNLFDAGLRGEAIVSANANQFRSNFAKWNLGVDYQFTPEFYSLAEYHFNGEGARTKETYELLRLINGEILNLGRRYAALSASYLIHPLVNVSVTGIANTDDGSKFLSATTTYSAADEISLSLGGQIFLGETLTEYWYYPNVAFLKGEIYF